MISLPSNQKLLSPKSCFPPITITLQLRNQQCVSIRQSNNSSHTFHYSVFLSSFSNRLIWKKMYLYLIIVYLKRSKKFYHYTKIDPYVFNLFWSMFSAPLFWPISGAKNGLKRVKFWTCDTMSPGPIESLLLVVLTSRRWAQGWYCWLVFTSRR